jgi:hypothetical protein
MNQRDIQTKLDVIIDNLDKVNIESRADKPEGMIPALPKIAKHSAYPSGTFSRDLA